MHCGHSYAAGACVTKTFPQAVQVRMLAPSGHLVVEGLSNNHRARLELDDLGDEAPAGVEQRVQGKSLALFHAECECRAPNVVFLQSSLRTIYS